MFQELQLCLDVRFSGSSGEGWQLPIPARRAHSGAHLGPLACPASYSLEHRAGPWALVAVPHTLPASPKATHAQLWPAQASARDPASEQMCRT